MQKLFKGKLKRLNYSQKVHLGIFGTFGLVTFFLMAASTSWFTRIVHVFPFTMSIIMALAVLAGLILTIY